MSSYANGQSMNPEPRKSRPNALKAVRPTPPGVMAPLAIEPSAGPGLESFRHVLDAMPANVVFADLSGSIRYVNRRALDSLRAFESQLGFRGDELVGKSLDMLQRAWPGVPRFDPRNLPFSADVAVGADTFNFQLTPVYDTRGDLAGVSQSWTLITETVNLRRAQNEAAAMSSALSRAMAVIEFTSDGTVLDANSNFLGALGYSLEEIQGKHHRMFCSTTRQSRRVTREGIRRLRGVA